jgi:hypothetical protein
MPARAADLVSQQNAAEDLVLRVAWTLFGCGRSFERFLEDSVHGGTRALEALRQ